MKLLCCFGPKADPQEFSHVDKQKVQQEEQQPVKQRKRVGSDDASPIASEQTDSQRPSLSGQSLAAKHSAEERTLRTAAAKYTESATDVLGRKFKPTPPSPSESADLSDDAPVVTAVPRAVHEPSAADVKQPVPVNVTASKRAVGQANGWAGDALERTANQSQDLKLNTEDVLLDEIANFSDLSSATSSPHKANTTATSSPVRSQNAQVPPRPANSISSPLLKSQSNHAAKAGALLDRQNSSLSDLSDPDEFETYGRGQGRVSRCGSDEQRKTKPGFVNPMFTDDEEEQETEVSENSPTMPNENARSNARRSNTDKPTPSTTQAWEATATDSEQSAYIPSPSRGARRQISIGNPANNRQSTVQPPTAVTGQPPLRSDKSDFTQYSGPADVHSTKAVPFTTSTTQNAASTETVDAALADDSQPTRPKSDLSGESRSSADDMPPIKTTTSGSAAQLQRQSSRVSSRTVSSPSSSGPSSPVAHANKLATSAPGSAATWSSATTVDEHVGGPEEATSTSEQQATSKPGQAQDSSSAPEHESRGIQLAAHNYAHNSDSVTAPQQRPAKYSVSLPNTNYSTNWNQESTTTHVQSTQPHRELPGTDDTEEVRPQVSTAAKTDFAVISTASELAQDKNQPSSSLDPQGQGLNKTMEAEHDQEQPVAGLVAAPKSGSVPEVDSMQASSHAYQDDGLADKDAPQTVQAVQTSKHDVSQAMHLFSNDPGHGLTPVRTTAEARKVSLESTLSAASSEGRYSMSDSSYTPNSVKSASRAATGSRIPTYMQSTKASANRLARTQADTETDGSSETSSTTGSASFSTSNNARRTLIPAPSSNSNAVQNPSPLSKTASARTQIPTLPRNTSPLTPGQSSTPPSKPAPRDLAPPGSQVRSSIKTLPTHTTDSADPLRASTSSLPARPFSGPLQSSTTPAKPSTPKPRTQLSGAASAPIPQPSKAEDTQRSHNTPTHKTADATLARALDASGTKSRQSSGSKAADLSTAGPSATTAKTTDTPTAKLPKSPTLKTVATSAAKGAEPSASATVTTTKTSSTKPTPSNKTHIPSSSSNAPSTKANTQSGSVPPSKAPQPTTPSSTAECEPLSRTDSVDTQSSSASNKPLAASQANNGLPFAAWRLVRLKRAMPCDARCGTELQETHDGERELFQCEEVLQPGGLAAVCSHTFTEEDGTTRPRTWVFCPDPLCLDSKPTGSSLPAWPKKIPLEGGCKVTRTEYNNLKDLGLDIAAPVRAPAPAAQQPAPAEAAAT